MLRKHIDHIEDEYYEDFLRAFSATKPVLNRVYLNKYRGKLLVSISAKKDASNEIIVKPEGIVFSAA